MFAHVTTAPGTVAPDPLTLALLTFGLGVVALIVVAVPASRTGRLDTVAVPFALWSAILAAGLSLGAAAIHFAAIGGHFAEHPPYGIAFAALAWFQVGWAVARLFVPGRRVAVVAIAVNLGALGVWAASRTVGLPIGPAPGEVEPVGPLDLAASAMEIALIVVLTWERSVASGRLRPALPGAGALVVLGSSALAVVLLTTAAFAVSGGDPHGGVAHDGVAHVRDVPVDGAPSPPPVEPAPSGVPVPAPSAPRSTASPDPSSSPAPSPSRHVTLSPRSTPSPGVTPPRPTAQPPTTGPTAAPRPVPTISPVRFAPGTIRFGTGLGEDGDIAGPTTRFAEGEEAVWIAEFREPAGTSSIRMLIVQVLDDGREFEHWREEVSLADPHNRRFTGRADLSAFLHGGHGSYRLRYVRGDVLLAEGMFEFFT